MIKNKKKLNSTSLRKDALAILDAGYHAINIEYLIQRRVKRSGSKLAIRHFGEDLLVNLSDFDRVHIVGFGKGSYRAVSGIADVLGKYCTSATALDVKNAVPNLSSPTSHLSSLAPHVKVFFGTHPKPSLPNVRATQYIVRLLETTGERDLILFFVGGGGSSLLCGSEDELRASVNIFDRLTQKGATIKELNTVRKHLSPVKGGGLAYFAYPSELISLVVSDVCGNDLSVIASGPTVCDPTTIQDAKRVLKKYGILYGKLKFVHTPCDKKYFERSTHILFACNQDALEAMREKARVLGYHPRIISLAQEGDAHALFTPLLKKIKKGEMFLLGGETTVQLSKKHGKGGRNQEAVLAAVAGAYEGRSSLAGALVTSVASDGYDNTPVAGALADEKTMRVVIAKGVDPKKYLAKNDSYAFFKKVGGHIEVERTAFNVSDVMMVIKKGQKGRGLRGE